MSVETGVDKEPLRERLGKWISSIRRELGHMDRKMFLVMTIVQRTVAVPLCLIVHALEVLHTNSYTLRYLKIISTGDEEVWYLCTHDTAAAVRMDFNTGLNCRDPGRYDA